MKLSYLTEVLNKYKVNFEKDGLPDPEVVVRVNGGDELELVDDFCSSISTLREGQYVCLFTYDEKEYFSDAEPFILKPVKRSLFTKIKWFFQDKWDWLKSYKDY